MGVIRQQAGVDAAFDVADFTVLHHDTGFNFAVFDSDVIAEGRIRADITVFDDDVVTDNDGDHRKHIGEKYSEYLADPNVKLCYDTDDKLHTLELQILAANSLDEMNKALSRNESSKEDLASYMISNKTECAFKLFQYERPITMPSYILDALNG